MISRWLFAKLSRSTSTGQFIPEIDGLRSLAIAGVIAFHLAGYVTEKTPHPFVQTPFDNFFFRLLRTGHIGVQLFFIVSGFVVALPFATHRLAAGKSVNLKRYFLRRLTRIEPPYIIALIFWLLAFGISGLSDHTFPQLLRHFPASLFYLHNLIYRGPSWILPPAWSLEIEIQFYLLAPLFTLIYLVRNPTLRRSILLFSIFAFAILQSFLRPPDMLNGLHLDQEIHYFLIGLLLVDFYILHARQNPPSRPLLNDILATLAAALLGICLLYRPAAQLPITFLIFIFVAAILRSRYLRALLRNPWIYTFGGMCYTTYLYHGFFKALPGHFTIRLQIGHHFWLNFLVQAAMLFPIIIVGSTILFLLTEKPFMRSASHIRTQPLT